MVRLPALPTVAGDGPVKAVVCIGDATLTIVIVGTYGRRRREY